jgi:hypothetical protein
VTGLAASWRWGKRHNAAKGDKILLQNQQK